jgi:hypothetical protein
MAPSSRSMIGLGLALVIVCCWMPSRVTAECIVPPPPCEALKDAPIVLLADVVDAIAPWEHPGQPNALLSNDVRLRVIEAFKGVPAGQSEITASLHVSVETPVVLVKGETYLLYVYVGDKGTWGTGCTRTRRAARTDPEVRELRRCK